MPTALCDELLLLLFMQRQRALSEGLDDPERAGRVDRLLVVKETACDLLDGLLQKWDEIHPTPKPSES